MLFLNSFNAFVTEAHLYKNFFFSQLVIWNVGQGQWITEVHDDHCIHFDLGGEIDVSSKALKLCLRKQNYLYLSHWDWDHISYAAKFAARVQTACLASLPEGPASLRKREMIERIPICKQTPAEVRVLYRPFPRPRLLSNDLSQVLESKTFRTLIPGDSTKSQEKIWSPAVPSKILGLVLGHHGSRTSTSPQMMAHLSNLKWAVASARKKKYGHPHKEVVAILKKAKVPLLRTEDWGNLHFLSKEEMGVGTNK